jgi:hypothetical protein
MYDMPPASPRICNTADVQNLNIKASGKKGMGFIVIFHPEYSMQLVITAERFRHGCGGMPQEKPDRANLHCKDAYRLCSSSDC